MWRMLFPLTLGWLAAGVPFQPASPILVTEFVADPSPTPQCHASTIVETRSGLVAAWFGGTRERHPDVGIWVSRHVDGRWTPPVEVADGVQPDGSRHPTWNPVLFQPRAGPLMLFYKVGPSPSSWWGVLRTSPDEGKTWSEARRLPDGILGPIKNKPIQFADGTLLCPSSSETSGWTVHFERTPDLGATWKTTGPLNDPQAIAAIQPTLLRRRDGRLQALVRTKQGTIHSLESADQGVTWGPLQPLDLPNPNSGLDAVTLADGRFLLVYNDARGSNGRLDAGRGVLGVAVSSDGRQWRRVLTLEDETGQEFSYPAVIQARDGRIHVTYTWKRQRVRHVVIDPGKL
jgi:predicted neuraminidase